MDKNAAKFADVTDEFWANDYSCVPHEWTGFGAKRKCPLQTSSVCLLRAEQSNENDGAKVNNRDEVLTYLQ